jgi:hypothetical protein
MSQAKNQYEVGSKECFMLVSCLPYSLTSKMEAAFSSETSVDFQQITWRYTPDDRTLHNHCCENLKSCIFLLSICKWFFTSWIKNSNFSSSKGKTKEFNMLVMV